MLHVVNFSFKIPDYSMAVNTTSRSANWSRGLSPFILGPVALYNGFISKNVENAWQYSKCYEYYLENGEPGEQYFKWAQEGWNCSRAERYPMGRDVKPLYSWWDGKKLSYVEAREQIYLPLYSKAVKDTDAFLKLKLMFEDKEEIYLQDFDAHNLTPPVDYWALVRNPHIKVGHAYVLAMMLEGFI